MRVLAVDGPEALQVRRLAAKVGTSTMTVYTHFGGMSQLVTEIRREGFIRFIRHLDEVTPGGDPVADLLALGLAYRDYGVNNLQLYRLMFAVTSAGGRQGGKDSVAAITREPMPEGQAAYDRLVTAVTRVIETGDTCQESPSSAAAQIWSALHGYVLLEISDSFGNSGESVGRVLLPLLTKLAVGIGADPEHATRARQAAASQFTL